MCGASSLQANSSLRLEPLISLLLGMHGTILARIVTKLRSLHRASRNADTLIYGFCGVGFFQGNLAGVQRRGAGQELSQSSLWTRAGSIRKVSGFGLGP